MNNFTRLVIIHNEIIIGTEANGSARRRYLHTESLIPGAVSLLLDRDNNGELSYLSVSLRAETSEQMARGNKEKLQNINVLPSGCKI